MEPQKSFKERVKECAINNAAQFKKIFIENEYCIISEAFEETGYYVVKAHAGNYLHLVGVNTSIPADIFFKKCLNGTLTENDFDFSKRGVGSNALKGAVREKIKVMPDMMDLFNGEPIDIQQSFKRNQVECAIASSDGVCTLGFSESGHPKSLLKGDYLDFTKRCTVDAIVSKSEGSEKFDCIVMNNLVDSSYINEEIKEILTEAVSEELLREQEMKDTNENN